MRSLSLFINKDPIEEQGGLNLYGFCGNNGVNRWDLLGMDPPWWEAGVVAVGQAPISPGGPGLPMPLNYTGGDPGAFLRNPYVSNGGATAFGAFTVALVATGNIEFAPLAVYLGVQGLTQSAAGTANLISYSTGTPASDLFPNTGLAGTFNGTANVIVGNSPNANSFYSSSLDFTGNLLGGIPFVAPAYSSTEPSFISAPYADAIGVASTGQGALELIPDSPAASNPALPSNSANVAPSSAPAPFVVPNLGAGSANSFSGAFYRGLYNLHFAIPNGSSSTGSNNTPSSNVDYTLPTFHVTGTRPANAPAAGSASTVPSVSSSIFVNMEGATVVSDPAGIASILGSIPGQKPQIILPIPQK